MLFYKIDLWFKKFSADMKAFNLTLQLCFVNHRNTLQSFEC